MICLAVLIAAAAGAGLFFLFLSPGARPSFVIVSVDTLRADRLGCYGNGMWNRSPSPAADALAEKGLLFEKCFVPRGQTHPAIASLLTGKYPITHGLRENGQKPEPRHGSFVELLAERNYATAGFAANLGAFTLRNPPRPAWWTRGFETFGDGYAGNPAGEIGSVFQHQRLWDDRVEKQALQWIADHGKRRGRPFLLWVHFYDVHKPYFPDRSYPDFYPEYDGGLKTGERAGGHGASPDPAAALKAGINGATINNQPLSGEDHRYVLACYDAGVAGVDARIGRIFDALEKLGLMENTWTIYTSDHGEELGDHNNYYYHGASIYDSVLRVPLIVAGPGVSCSARTDALVQNLDLAPTILELAGVPAPKEMEGVSFLEPLLRSGAGEGGAGGKGRRFAVAEWRDLIYSISDGRSKYILNPKGACPVKPPWDLRNPGAAGFIYGVEEFYDLVRDPREGNNLVDQRREDSERLKKELRRWLDEHGPKTSYRPGHFTPEERENLEALGYITPGPEQRDVRFKRNK